MCVFETKLLSSRVNQLWKLKNVKTQFKRVSVILCIDFCPGLATPEPNSNPLSLPTRSVLQTEEVLLYAEPFQLISWVLPLQPSNPDLQFHSTNYRVDNFQLKASASCITYILQVLPFSPSLQSPPNRSDKQGYPFNMRYAAFQVIQKVPFPKPFYDNSMIHSFSRKAPSRVSPILESNTSFSFHCLCRPASSRTRGKEQLTERKHWNSEDC